MTAEPLTAAVVYPGGLRARYRWVGPGGEVALFALTEGDGTLLDHGDRGAAASARRCRAELRRVDGPGGTWTARFESLIYDEPTGVAWDRAGLLVVGYGFAAYGLRARTGELRWVHRAGSPLIAVLGSSRLDHLIVQAEIETFALEEDGHVLWRAAHSDVVTGAELVAGRLVLAGYGGEIAALDARTGRPIS